MPFPFFIRLEENTVSVRFFDFITGFFDGLTGLTIAIGAILTLFVVMHLTAQLDWSEVFGSNKRPPPAPHPYRCGEAG